MRVIVGTFALVMIAACSGDGGGGGGEERATQEIEPNDDLGSATLIGSSGRWSFEGDCSEGGDNDYFRVDAQAGTLFASVIVAGVGSVELCADDDNGPNSAQCDGFNEPPEQVREITMNLSAPISIFLGIYCDGLSNSYSGSVEVP